MSGLVVRDARESDLTEIANAVAAQPLLDRYGVTAAALEKNLGSAMARGDDLMVAEEGDALCGMAWFLRSGTFALGGYLRLIAVFPGREGRGIGGLLLDEVEQRTKLVSRFLFLLVSAHNTDARRFYEKRGYSEAGELKALLKPDLDEIILWRQLA